MSDEMKRVSEAMAAELGPGWSSEVYFMGGMVWASAKNDMMRVVSSADYPSFTATVETEKIALSPSISYPFIGTGKTAMRAVHDLIAQVREVHTMVGFILTEMVESLDENLQAV